MRFNRLTVLDSAQAVRPGQRYWNCECDCGNRVVKSSDAIKRAAGCSLRCRLSGKADNVYESSKKWFLRNYQSGARVRGITWDLSDGDFYLIAAQPCYYCGSEPREYGRADKDRKRYTVKANGIDRVNPAIGYHRLNCVPCCSVCNLAKGSMSLLDFESWIRKVHNHIKNEIR